MKLLSKLLDKTTIAESRVEQFEEVHEHNSVPAIALMEREEEAEKEQECYHCAHEAAFKIAR